MRTIYISKKALAFVAVVAVSAALLAGASAANRNAQPAPAATTQACISINPVDVNAIVVESNREKLAEVQEWLDAQTAPATTDATPSQSQQSRTPQAPASHGTNADEPPNPDDYVYADEYADAAESWFAAHGYASPYDAAYQHWIDYEDGWYESDE